MNYNKFDIEALKTTADTDLAEALAKNEKRGARWDIAQRVIRIAGSAILSLSALLGFSFSGIGGFAGGLVFGAIAWVVIFFVCKLVLHEDFDPEEAKTRTQLFKEFVDGTVSQLKYAVFHSNETYSDYDGERDASGEDFIVLYNKDEKYPCGLLDDDKPNDIASAKLFLDGGIVNIGRDFHFRKIEREQAKANITPTGFLIKALMEDKQYGYNQEELVALGYDREHLDETGWTQGRLKELHELFIRRMEVLQKEALAKEIADKDRESREKIAKEDRKSWEKKWDQTFKK